MNRQRTDIVVIGGGLAGLLASARLASTGRTVTLLAPPRQPDRRTTALLGSSVDALKAVGVWERLAPVSQPLRGVRIIDDSARLLHAPEVLFAASDIGRDAFGINVPNEPLLRALEDAAATAGVRTLDAKASGIRQEPDRIVVLLDGGAEIPATLAVAADGRNSPSREAAGIAMRRTELPQSALVCNVRHELPHDDISNEFHTPDGPFTLVPLSEHQCGVVWVARPAEAARLSRLPPDALAAAIERRSHSILGEIEITSPVQLFPLSSGIAERAAEGRLLLIGEAAHVVPPIAAQGFNMTVRDIDAIVELLNATAGDSGFADIAASFRQRREPDTRLTIEAVKMINGTLLSAALPAQLARTGGLFALANLPPVRRLIIREGLSRR